MASRTKLPTVKESNSAPFDDGRQLLSALVEIPNHETQVQPYAWGGELVGPVTEPDLAEEMTASYTLIVGHHESNPRRSSFSTAQSFLDWVEFEEVTLPPRRNVNKELRDKTFAPLNDLEVELPGHIGVKGLGGFVETTHNIFHSHIQLDFMESERDILLPQPPPGAPRLEPLSRKELDRLEAELFDLAKYTGSSNFLTTVTWTEERKSGTITLYEVKFNSRGHAVGIRPVAAMKEVPFQILVSMREHKKLKRKVVFVATDDDSPGFKWKANPSRGPTYVKLGDTEKSEPSHSRERRSTSRGSHASHRGPRLADADGVHATIPQFVALLHADRSILEDIRSSHVATLDTDDGEFVTAVNVLKHPRSNSHLGDLVHVAVLIPNEAEWAEEVIYWTDDEGLVEFRRRKYWDLIERGRRRDRGSRSRSRQSAHSSHSAHSARSRHASPDGRDQTRSRSRSRHLSLHSLF